MADEKARERAQREVAKTEQARFDDWKQIQEEAGYTVEGDSFSNAKVVELPEGPTHDVRTSG